MYITTGYQRSTQLKVQVYNNGTLVAENTFSLLEAFVYNGVNYSQLDNDQLARLPLDAYNERVEAYAAYIEENYQSQYPGLDISTDGARVHNENACPINQPVEQ